MTLVDSDLAVPTCGASLSQLTFVAVTVRYSFAVKTICLKRLFSCLTMLQGILQTWKMLSQSSRLR